MARHQKLHHCGGIAPDVEIHHLFVEFLSAGGGNTNSINAVAHKDAVHHQSGGAFVAIKEKLLQRAKEKEF